MNKIKKGLFWFILIQPFLDIYFFYVPPVTNIFPFSPSTIIRMIFLGILFLLFWRQKKGDLKVKFILSYSLLLVAYFIVHLQHIAHMYTLSPDTLGISVPGEIFYVIRMVVPLIVLLISSHISFNERDLQKIVYTLVGLISGSIVITNIFKVSLASYGGGWIHGSIFTWTSHQYSFYGLASKGLFYFANSISAIEVMLLPLLMYYVIKKISWLNITLIFTHFLALCMIGTKTAFFGFILTMVMMLIIYLYFTFIKKELTFSIKVIASIILLLGLSVALLPISPTMNRSQSNEYVANTRESDKKSVKERDKELAEHVKTNGKETKVMKYIRKNYFKYSLEPRFVESNYSYRVDPNFWLDVMKWPLADRINYRKIETAMLNRVKKVSNNRLDDWLGIGYTRMNKIFNLERDFVSQWYSMGYIGVLLLIMPYVFILLWAIFQVLSSYQNKFTFKNVSYLVAIGLMLALSLYSGNVMDFLMDTILLAFFEGQLMKELASC